METEQGTLYIGENTFPVPVEVTTKDGDIIGVSFSNHSNPPGITISLSPKIKAIREWTTAAIGKAVSNLAGRAWVKAKIVEAKRELRENAELNLSGRAWVKAEVADAKRELRESFAMGEENINVTEKINHMVKSAIAALTEIPPEEGRGEQSGDYWTPYEEKRLKREIVDAMNCIAKGHGRSLNGIGCKYKRLRRDGFTWY